MAKTTEETAEVPATNSEATPEKKKRDRKPTMFKQRIRLSLFVHGDVKDQFHAQSFGDAIAAAGIVNGEDADNPLAHRVVARSRAGSKSTIESVSIYVATPGYEFPTAGEAGVRINADLWSEIKQQLEARGLPADQEGLKALAAALAATAPTTSEASAE